MTTVKMSDTYLLIEGHSGYANKGQDIVCAGVSILYFTLESILSDLKDEHLIDYRASTGDGFAEVVILRGQEHTKQAMQYTRKGLMLLSESYQDFIQFH